MRCLAQPVPAPACCRPTGPNPDVSQLVRSLAAQCAARGAGPARPAGQLRAARRRQAGRGPGLAALSRSGGRRWAGAAGLRGQCSRARQVQHPEGAGGRAVETGGVFSGGPAWRRRRFGQALGPAVSPVRGLCRTLRSAGRRECAYPVAGGRCAGAWPRGGQDVFGQGRGTRTGADRPGYRRGARRAVDAKRRAPQVQRQARRPGQSSPGTETGDRTCARLPSARSLAAPPAHGAADAAADCRIFRAQARARLGRHERRRTCGVHDACRPGACRLGAGATRCEDQASADRRVPGHQPAAMAGPARMALKLCGSRRQHWERRGWRARRLHRRRSQAKHLPLSPGRAPGVPGGAGVCRPGAGRGTSELRPHASQCAGHHGDGERRHGRSAGGGTLRRLPRTHDGVARSWRRGTVAADFARGGGRFGDNASAVARQSHGSARIARRKAGDPGMPAGCRLDCGADRAGGPAPADHGACAAAGPVDRDGGATAGAAHSGPAAGKGRPLRSP